MEPKPREWKQDLEEMKKVGGFVAVVVAWLVGAPIATILGMLTDDKAQAKQLLEVLIPTLPLTLAVALIVVGWLKKWFGQEHGLWLWPTVILIGSLFLASQLGYGVGSLWANTMSVRGPLPEVALAVVVNILGGYFRVFGANYFIASLIVGGFIAWAVSEKIMPHVERL